MLLSTLFVPFTVSLFLLLDVCYVLEFGLEVTIVMLCPLPALHSFASRAADIFFVEKVGNFTSLWELGFFSGLGLLRVYE